MASGDALAEWTAVGGELPATSSAAYNFVNNQAVLDFDPTNDEGVYFSGILPNHYGGGGLSLLMIWTSVSAVAGDCVFTVSVERQAVGHAVGTDSFATANSITVTAPGVAGNLVYSTITFTSGAQMDSLAINERFRLLVTRDANAGGDTMAGDMRLIHLYLREL
jgi:hypothetical protein